MPKPSTTKPAAQRRPITPELIRDALASIPPDTDRDTWARVGMAVKASDLATDAAFELWNEWSARGATYSERNAIDTWRSLKAGGAVTVGTLFGMAKDHGFQFPVAGGGSSHAQVQTPAPQEAARLAAEKLRQRETEAARYSQRADDAARAAVVMWADASEPAAATAAGYLVRKGVQPHGVRVLPSGVLLVPMRNATGELQNLQRIAPDKPTDGSSDKRFLPGGRKSGLWHLIGCTDGAAVLLVAEGYATAASLFEATGRPVAVAFDAGNLVHVTRALRTLHATLPLLVCADDDRATQARTGHNPGRDKATSAARAAATATGPARAVWPAFDATADAACSDFNDLASVGGLDAVRGIVESACAALLAGQPEPNADKRRRTSKTAHNERSAVGECNAAGGGAGGHSGPLNGRAGPNVEGDHAAADNNAGDGGGGAFTASTDPFELGESGVWFNGRDREGNAKRPMWLCTPLAVTARTRADDANGWGLLLQFTDPDGNAKTWAMPASLLSGEGAEWAGRLRDMGLRMAPGTAARNLIAQYIDTRGPTERVTCTDRVGWHGSVYVLPSGSIGTAEGRRYVFQSDAGMEDTFRRHGELSAWQSGVASLAVDNSRIVFALGCAFAGPALRLAGMESGGFHLRGTSSMGKTTALKVAASVWGRPSYMQRWRTTDNALEATAVQHCDGLLILDEFGQLDPRVAGECAYMLANDQEKGRATRGGLTRKRRTWRLLFLSSGEVSLADHMAEAGKRTQAGMEVRMVDVPLDAGAGMGGIENTHGHSGAAELADAITAAAARHYGSAGRAWLEWLCANHAGLPDLLVARTDHHRAELVPEAASEQVRRVGSRFALVAAAGELATQASITGWQPGQAAWAVRQCFNAWLGARGHLDNGEEVAMLRQVRAWLEKNGDALLTYTHRGTDDHKPATPLRAGFKRLIDDDGKPLKIDAATDYLERNSAPETSERRMALVEYLLLPEAFRRDVCKGFDAQAVAQVLKRRGHLVFEADRLSIKHRLPGLGKATCYHVKPSIFADEMGGL
jgi:putative DNA primase/helicase